MPYKILLNHLPPKDSTQGWQIRIAVDPKALRQDLQDNKIALIEKILTETCNPYKLYLEMYIISDEHELTQDYDGSTSDKGKCLHQRGKEICIYLGDAGSEATHSPEDYKKIILTLWQRLQLAEVPLVSVEPQGDKKILCLGGALTPFSFTCTPPIEVRRKSKWHQKDGILFKTFVANRNHPILGIAFSQEDLDEYAIQYNARYEGDKYIEEMNKRCEESRDRIKTTMAAIYQNTSNYSARVLFNQNEIEEIKNLLVKHIDDLADIKGQKKLAYQVKFKEMLEKKSTYKDLINGYPHNSDSEFSQHDAIVILSKMPNITVEQFDKAINDLRISYDSYIADIQEDFANLHNCIYGYNPDSMQSSVYINYDFSFLDSSLDFHDYINDCVDKNPAEMQIIYRKMAIIEQESYAVAEFKKYVFRDVNINTLSALDKMKLGIGRYLAKPRAIFGSHLGIFSAIFDNACGVRRAQIFLNALNNPSYTHRRKLLVAYAVFSNPQANELKNTVASAFGSSCEVVKDIFKTQSKFFLNVQDQSELDAANKTIGRIIHFVNGYTNPLSATALPEICWRDFDAPPRTPSVNSRV